ncbi:MAG: rhodanese-like domain-containing protein, partial [Flavobacterium sp.]
NDSVLFVDVRNSDELPKISLKNQVQIPLMLLENEIEKIDKNQMIYVFCQSGIRSKMAVEVLQKHQFKDVKSIAGGVLAMKNLLKEEIKI